MAGSGMHRMVDRMEIPVQRESIINFDDQVVLSSPISHEADDKVRIFVQFILN